MCMTLLLDSSNGKQGLRWQSEEVVTKKRGEATDQSKKLEGKHTPSPDWFWL